MIDRDKYGIICDYQEDEKRYDGGDSAFFTGMSAFAGDQEDAHRMKKFITYKDDWIGLVVRHPYDEHWNIPDLMSRDQAVAFFAGLDEREAQGFTNNDAMKRVALKYARSWFINKDFLAPDVKLYFYLKAEAEPPIGIKITGYAMAFLSLLWNCFVDPDHEMNQAIAINTKLGDWWISKLCQWHPDIIKNIMEYYGGWRNKREIGEGICAKLANYIKAKGS